MTYGLMAFILVYYTLLHLNNGRKSSQWSKNEVLTLWSEIDYFELKVKFN